MYRFHPSVRWNAGYPDRQSIVAQITQLWERYGLESRTKFDTRVSSVSRDSKRRWIINGDANTYGTFEGVIAAIGSCGEPKMPHIQDQEKFRGEIHHSSRLDGKTAQGKKVLIVGGGASAVEGLEFVVHTHAHKTSVLARSEKWIIPRNAIIDTLLAFNIFGQETIFSWIPETILRIFFYRDLQDLAPVDTGLFTGTPMVNSDVLDQVRQGKAEWLRGDIQRFTEKGIMFNHRDRGVPKGGPGREEELEADMVIMATGYQRPSLSFLPKECFDPAYQPPSWYLQCFPPAHMSICGINTTYTNAIGTVGNWHIGIYTRLLLVFLVDPLARPQEYWMKKWIDMTRFVKRRSPTGAFDFFTYSELLYWFVFCIVINPFRWKWALFVFFGLGRDLPMKVVRQEDRARYQLGLDKKLY
ncbi:hypothetical protein MMC25_007512 [Agyrium rufum]|nr:hypothetical protein [Agyrium rufum]